MKRASAMAMILLLSYFYFVVTIEARSLEDIRASRELRVCISPIHPSICSAQPEGCRDDCRITGPAYEAALAFASYLGKDIAPRFLRVDWDEQFFDEKGVTVQEGDYEPELLASGRCDLYPSNLAKNEWRSKKMDFVTLFPNRMMVIVRRSERERFKTLADLGGKTAAIEKNTSYHTWMQEQNQGVLQSNPIKIRLMATDEGLRSVDGGEVDFSMIDSDAAIWVIQHQYRNTDMAFAVGATDEIGWAFRKEDKDLQELVGVFFEQQRGSENSELNSIWQKYYGMSLTHFIGLVGSIPE